MKILIRYIYLIMLLFFVGCSGLDKEQLIGNYYLTAIDYVNENMSLSYKLESGNFIGVVNPTVFALGYSKEYIIVKQHPLEFSKPPNKSITNYFIVPIKDKIHQFPDENKIGPLTALEFKEKRKALGISEELTFTKVIEDVE